MVLEDESSDDQSSLPYMHSSSTDGLNEVPFSLEDPDYKELELDVMSPCEKHGMASERLVAFEETDTGRRFLACAQPADAKTARVNENLESSFTIHHLTEEKTKLDANYDKLVQDVHELMNFQEDKVVDFRHLQSAITYQQEVRKDLIDDMKAQMASEMAKKDEETQKLTLKYELLLNLTRAQATVIQNLKLNKMKEKQVLTEASMNLELKNAELTKCQEKLTQEKLELKLQVADLLKGNEKHIEEKWQLEFQNEKLKEKFRGIQAILEK
ncbi:uncharacterized protein [Aegilops tauschii subsp. strangulata]|uniref:uncharacterized protein n=1 Tax=Aegilops tauschii subsp. strangulata TaxID=200361 RepID=UPI000989DCD8